MRFYRGDYQVRDQEVIESRDLKTITSMLQDKLERIKSDPATWQTLYYCKDDNSFWLMSYEQPEMHGGGIKVLREIPKSDADKFRNKLEKK